MEKENLRKILVFVSGKYSGNVKENIGRAREMAVRLWSEGFTVICPHLNTRYFDIIIDCRCDYEDFIEGYLNILHRCDVLFQLEGWEDSLGAIRENDYAILNKIPVVTTVGKLREMFGYV